MGPLYKFQGFQFADAPVEADGKAKLRAAIDSARRVSEGHGESSAAGGSCGVRNVRMLSLAAEGGLPNRRHFGWMAGTSSGGCVVMYGAACSDGDVAQREKDAGLVDFIQNAPIAMHWLSSEGIVLWANQTELSVLGYTAEEFIGQPITKSCPDEKDLMLEISKQLGSGSSIRDVPVPRTAGWRTC